MSPIPQKIRFRLESDPFMSRCIHDDDDCYGRIEWEHAFMYAGKQVQEWWAIVPCCFYHHRGEGLDKQFNMIVGLLRLISAGKAEMDEVKEKYPNNSWNIIVERYYGKVENAVQLELITKRINECKASFSG